MRTNLPRAVRALRIQQGLTQAALAERTGVSRELVSRLERSDFEGMTFRARVCLPKDWADILTSSSGGEASGWIDSWMQHMPPFRKP